MLVNAANGRHHSCSGNNVCYIAVLADVFVAQLRPVLADSLCDRTKLMKWLLSRIRVKASDSNKQYASEILSILVQVRGLGNCTAVLEGDSFSGPSPFGSPSAMALRS